MLRLHDPNQYFAHKHPEASATMPGFMSADDKIKLDSLSVGGGVADGDRGDVIVTDSGSVWTLDVSGVGAGTYKSVTVDTKGRVTAGSNPTTLAGYGITDAPTLTGTGATGTWSIDIAGKSTELAVSFKVPDTAGSDSANYYKFARVTLPVRYNDNQLSILTKYAGNGGTVDFSEILTIRVKQQDPFGSDPFVSVSSTSLNNVNSGTVSYIIVQNTPTTIVEFYYQSNLGWNSVDMSVLQKSGAGTFEFLNSSYVNSLTGAVTIQKDSFIRCTGMAANTMAYFDGTSPKAVITTLTSFARTLLDDTDAATMRSTLELGTAAQSAASSFAPSSHTHTMSEITDLVSTLNGKQKTITQSPTSPSSPSIGDLWIQTS